MLASAGSPGGPRLSIRGRLTTFLALLSAASIVLLLIFRSNEEAKIAMVARAEQLNAEVLFDRVFELRSTPISIWTRDYTQWDDMVRFVASPDPQWADENIAVGLANYDLDSAWVYRPDFTEVYPADGSHPDIGADRGPTSAELANLFGSDETPRFFALRDGALTETRGAPIHATGDLARVSPPSGWALVARVWDVDDWRDLANVTGIQLELLPGDAAGPQRPGPTPSGGAVGFVRYLPGFDSQGQGAAIRVRYHSEIVRALEARSRRESLIVIAVPVLLLLGLWWQLSRQVTGPLDAISHALRTGQPEALVALAGLRSEFGEVGALVLRSHEQKATLEREVARREQTEAELVEARERLEQRVVERTAELSRVNAELRREIRVRQNAEAEAKRARDEWELTFHTIPDFIAIIDTDGRAVRVNRAMSDLLDRGSGIERPCMLCAQPGATPEWRCVLQQPQGEMVAHSAEIEQPGLGMHLQVTVAPLPDANGEVIGCVQVAHDITARKRAEQTLAEALERLREQEAIIRRSSVIVWKAANAPGWPIEYLSEAIATFGYTPDDFTSGRVPFSSLIHPEDLPRLVSTVTDCLQRNANDYIFEYRIFTAGGEVRWLADRAWVVRDTGGAVTHFQGVSVDITERKEFEARLRFLSFHDSLTGLYNRTYFEEELARVGRGRRHAVSVLLADVDGLKVINDLRGHAAGDEVLRHVATTLRAAVRLEDVVARIGGDEFAAIMVGADAEAADAALARLEALAQRHRADGCGCGMALSAGIATALPGESLLEALRVADVMMYERRSQRMDRAFSGG